MSRIATGFIGVGSQGGPMAYRMLDAGYPLTIWARRQEVMDEYAAKGAATAASPAELGAACDHVGVCVVNDGDVAQVCDQLIPAMREGSLLAIHSTILPETCVALEQRCAERGIRFVDAPVSGGSPGAEAGTLTVMCGGEPDAFAQARPVFASFGRLIVLLGGAGAGQRAKIVNNALMAANMGLAHAAALAGEALGLDRSALHELINASSGRSFGYEVYARMPSPAAFAMGAKLLDKDVNLLAAILEDDINTEVLKSAADYFSGRQPPADGQPQENATVTFTADQFRLDGKVAIVTGAGGRGNSIGRAYALGLAGAGASVVVADLDQDGAKAVADEITATGGKAIAVQVDIADEASTLAMAEAATAAFGGIDILVNNAALMVDISYDNCETIPLADWNKAFAVNLNGALLCSRAVVPSMRARGGGRIVNQTSGGAYPATGLYGITKLALVGLTTTMAKQFGKDNITCNAIAPGNVTSDAGKLLVPDDSPFIQFLNATVATRARGEPDELVGPLLLLCSQAGGWISGQVIHVDGGWIMRP